MLQWLNTRYPTIQWTPCDGYIRGTTSDTGALININIELIKLIELIARDMTSTDPVLVDPFLVNTNEIHIDTTILRTLYEISVIIDQGYFN